MKKLVQKCSLFLDLPPVSMNACKTAVIFERKRQYREFNQKCLHFCINFAIFPKIPEKNCTFAGFRILGAFGALLWCLWDALGAPELNPINLVYFTTTKKSRAASSTASTHSKSA